MAVAHMAQNPQRCSEKGLVIMFFSYCQLAYKVLIYITIIIYSILQNKS